MRQDSETDGDPRYHLPRDTPIITPERAAKGDVLTGPPCKDCGATGKDKLSKLSCRACRGKGWVGSTNASAVAIDDVRFAQVQIVNILNYLWQEEIISEDEHDAGHTFEAWRNQHRVALGLQRSISGALEETFQVKLRAYGFVLLICRLSQLDVKAINKSLDVYASYATRAEANRERLAYRAAFHHLNDAIVPVRERISYLESVSEEERGHISDEQLKVLLAQIQKYK